MVSIIVIPIIIVSIIGLVSYLLYRFVIYDVLCSRSVDRTLQRYSIKKTQFQIIKEYYDGKGDNISEKEIKNLVKYYRQREPDQFLIMYDAIRDKLNTSDND